MSRVKNRIKADARTRFRTTSHLGKTRSRRERKRRRELILLLYLLLLLLLFWCVVVSFRIKKPFGRRATTTLFYARANVFPNTNTNEKSSATIIIIIIVVALFSQKRSR